MVFSVSPSVIVREVDATAVIPAIATPPAAIAGVFRWGPANERILLTSEDELVNRFGKPFANTSWQNYETFFTAADFLSYSNALYVTRVIDGANTAAFAAVGDPNRFFEAKYPGELGNSLEVSYMAGDRYEKDLLDVGDMTGTIGFNASNVSIDDVLTDIGLTPVENDIIRIGNDSIGFQDMIVSTFNVTSAVNANTALTEYTYNFTFKNKYVLSETDLSTLYVKFSWRYSGLVSSPPSAGSLHIAVIDRGGVITGTAGTVLEVYENVSTSSSAKLEDGTTNYYKDVIENRSAWISAGPPTLGSGSQVVYGALTGGLDGNGETTVSFGKVALGYDLYKDANEVDIAFVLQGKAVDSNLPNYLISNIGDRRKDCVVFISPTYDYVVAPANPGTKLTNVIAFRNNLQSSSYWFMDSGYKYRYDKYNDVYRWVPLNGDMAGLCSRIESWESPAGYKRGIIKNVVKLAFNPNKEQRDLLYGSDINPVISQVGQGILLFGDKTGLGRSSAFNRINVRRLFITVEKAIATVAASFLFDFNDEFTQTQFKNIVEPFLRDIQGRRGIIDFRVVSDATVNTPDVIDRNIFRGNIFIKPARSINIIELTFVATRTGVEFDEIVGQPL